MSSHCSPWSSSKARAAGSSPLRLRPLVRTIVKRPLTFSPWRRNLSSPSATACRGVEGRRLRLPGAPVPDDDVAGAVLLGGDDALEVEVLDRVVLDVDGHPPDGRVEGRALGHGPATRGRPRSRGGSRSGAGWRGGAGRRTGRSSAGRAAAGAGSGVFAKSRLRRYSSRGIGGQCARCRAAGRASRRPQPRISRSPALDLLAGASNRSIAGAEGSDPCTRREFREPSRRSTRCLP